MPHDSSAGGADLAFRIGLILWGLDLRGAEGERSEEDGQEQQHNWQLERGTLAARGGANKARSRFALKRSSAQGLQDLVQAWCGVDGGGCLSRQRH